MTTDLIILDLHGLLVDIRRPKWRYFRDVLGVELPSWNLDQEKILEEYARRGLGRADYKRHLIEMLRSEALDEATEISGAREFLEASPASWSFRIVTGVYIPRERLERHLARFDFPRIDGVVQMRTAQRPEAAERWGASLYFDDKRMQLREIEARGVRCVHVADPRYSSPTEHGTHYPSWTRVIDDLETLVRLAGYVDTAE